MLMRQKNRHFAHGDTLIEVIIALSIFATLAVMAIHTMNSGLYQAERALEITMARNEIDAQAEAIRFIQNNYVAEREYPTEKQQYSKLWSTILTKYAIGADRLTSENYDINNMNVKTCDDAYTRQVRDGSTRKAGFAINTRLLEPSSAITAAVGGKSYSDLLKHIVIAGDTTSGSSNYVLRPASLYPRGIYSVLNLGSIRDNTLGTGSATNTDKTLAETKVYRKADSIEGVWVIAVRGNNSNIVRSGHNAEFYDFYIRTCWQATGVTAPSTLTTIVRLYNPEVIE